MSFPGEFVGGDLFSLGTIQGIGRIDQFPAVDCYRSFGFAGLDTTRTAENAVDFIKTPVIPYFGDRSMLRGLSDNGKECTTHREDASHTVTEALEEVRIRPTPTNVKHPGTKGHVERVQPTVLHAFYQRVFQEKWSPSIAVLQKDLKEGLVEDNFERPHPGRRTNGRTPSELFFEPSKQPARVV